MYARPAISWTVDSVSSQNSPHKPVVHRQILYTLSKFLLTTSNVCWRRLLRVPWTARRSNQSIRKEVNLEYSLEGLILKLNTLATWCKEPTHCKDPDAGKYGGQEKGMTEDEMVGWHHWLNGYEFEQTLGDSGGQRSQACCSPWSHKESGTN